MYKVFNCGFFFEKFWIGNYVVGNVDCMFGKFVGDSCFDFGICVDWYGVFVDNDFVVGYQVVNIVGGIENVLEVG